MRYRVDRAGAVANEFLEINIVDVLDIHKDFKDFRFKDHEKFNCRAERRRLRFCFGFNGLAACACVKCTFGKREPASKHNKQDGRNSTFLVGLHLRGVFLCFGAHRHGTGWLADSTNKLADRRVIAPAPATVLRAYDKAWH